MDISSHSPKTTGHDLIRMLNRALEESPPSPALLAEVKDGADKLLQADRAAGYMILGILASLSGEVSLMEAHFASAMSFGRDEKVLHNYTVCLLHNQMYGKALQAGLDFYDKYQSPESVFLLAEAYDLLGLKRQSAHYMTILQEKMPQRLPGEAEAGFATYKDLLGEGYVRADLSSIRTKVMDGVTRDLEKHAELWQLLANR